MRKILLATTALVGFAVAGAAQAATSPLNVTVGGDVDFIAGFDHQSAKSVPVAYDRVGHDFETLYDLTFGINAKSGNGIEYGGMLDLNNKQDISNLFNGTSNGVNMNVADVFMSGAFGKVVLGDSHGATDLSVWAPTVGEGQVYGHYVDFLDTFSFGKNFIYGIDGSDHSTNITYFTPKVGNDSNKVQVGVSYVPEFYNYGSSVTQVSNSAAANILGNGQALSPYQNVVKGAVAYTGTFNPVTLGASADIITGNANAKSAGQSWILNAPVAAKVRDFTSFGGGLTGSMDGFTLGGNYTDLGHYDTVGLQSKNQNEYSVGLKYEFSKVGVGVSYLGGEGYDNMLALPTGTGTGSSYDYIKDFNTYGIGGVYTWAPGLTTNLDGMLFDQKTQAGNSNDGYVLLVSQKLTF